MKTYAYPTLLHLLFRNTTRYALTVKSLDMHFHRVGGVESLGISDWPTLVFQAEQLKPGLSKHKIYISTFGTEPTLRPRYITFPIIHFLVL